MSDYVIAETYLFPHEASVALASLREAGIAAIMQDEHTVNMQWLYSQAIGGIKLLVPGRDLAAARIILSTDYSDALKEQFGEDEEICTSCGGKNLSTFTKGKKPAYLMILLLGFPLFFYQHGLKCDDCGHFSKT